LFKYLIDRIYPGPVYWTMFSGLKPTELPSVSPGGW